MPAPELVRLIWLDAWVDGNEPINLDEAHTKHRPLQITTLGWLIYEDDTGVSVANEHYVDDNGWDVYRGRTFVPRGMVVSCEPLKKPRKPRVRKVLNEDSQTS